MQKEWQYVKNIVDAESADANAQDKTECEQLLGDNAGSSVSAGASTTACSEACSNQELFLET